MLSDAPVIVLPGAGGGSPDLAPFRQGFGEATHFATVRYPDWRRYLEPGFGFDVLLDDIVQSIAQVVPSGPIRIVGTSIGGHFGYLAATRLRGMGRDVSLLCVVDAFTFHTADASSGWVQRVVAICARLLVARRFKDILSVAHSRFWRLIFKLPQRWWLAVLRLAHRRGWLNSLLKLDPMLEFELNMRLLILTAAPGLAAIDRAPEQLQANAILLRTSAAVCADEDWRRRCPAILICEIPGDHDTMFEAGNITQMGQIFRAALSKFSATGAGAIAD
jgi:thioesterase domain-containing protein